MARIWEPGGPLFAALIRDLTILLVEDHPQAREATQQLLEGMGARVIAAEDGRDALDRLSDARPDLVLTDLAMPRLSGRQLLDHLRADPVHRELPVVAVSGWPASFDGTPPAFDAHLDKPFDVESLVAVLCRVICRRRLVFRRQRRRLRDAAAWERRRGQSLRQSSARVVKQAAATRARGRALLGYAA
jgi:CheY-like chemotaxis protein